MCSFAVNLGKFADNWLKNCGGNIRNGMVLVDPKSKPRATWTFAAEIWTFDGSTKVLKNNSQPVIHISHVRQSARIILDKAYLKPEEETKRATSVDELHKSNPTSSEEEEKLNKKKQIHHLGLEERNQQFKANLFSSLSHSSSSTSPQNVPEKKKGKLSDKVKKEKDVFEEIEISPLKKTRVILQFLYNPEYLIKDGYIIINESNLKAFGRITELFYDTLSKMYSNAPGKYEKKRKNSVPVIIRNTLIPAQNEDAKSQDDAFDLPLASKLSRNRRT